jgi:type II secretory pathway pseudopilin PulG
MFNLIVAVISIALIAAMAAASIFYGGTAFGSGTAQAQASTLVNNGQQISGAQQLYMIDNSGNRNSVNDMTAANGLVTENYLQAVPTPPANSTGADADDTGTWLISADGTFAYIVLNTAHAGANTSPADTVCAELVAQGGLLIENDGVTLAASSVIGTGTGEIDLGQDQFGCVVSGADTIDVDAATAHFVFKL